VAARKKDGNSPRGASGRGLCPVCRRAYTSSTIKDNGDLIYWHADVEIDGERKLVGCLITDNSSIRGVQFGPGDRPS
jgi:hypothetical protein